MVVLRLDAVAPHPPQKLPATSSQNTPAANPDRRRDGNCDKITTATAAVALAKGGNHYEERKRGAYGIRLYSEADLFRMPPALCDDITEASEKIA